MNNNLELLTRNHNELMELRLVLERSVSFFANVSIYLHLNQTGVLFALTYTILAGGAHY